MLRSARCIKAAKYYAPDSFQEMRIIRQHPHAKLPTGATHSEQGYRGIDHFGHFAGLTAIWNSDNRTGISAGWHCQGRHRVLLGKSAFL
jgi:hypothetical protein